MNRKILAVLLCLALAFGIFTACGGKKPAITNTDLALKSGDKVTATSSSGSAVKFKIDPAVNGITINEETGEVTYANTVAEGTKFKVIAYNDETESEPVEFTVAVPVENIHIFYNGSGVVKDGDSIGASSNKPSVQLSYALQTPVFGISVSEDGVVNFSSFISRDTEFTVVISGGDKSISRKFKTKLDDVYFSSLQEFVLDLEESKINNSEISSIAASGSVVFETNGDITASMVLTDEFIINALKYNGMLGEDETELVIEGAYALMGNTCMTATDLGTAEFKITVQNDFTLRGEINYSFKIDTMDISLLLVGYTESPDTNHYRTDTTFKLDYELSSEGLGEIFFIDTVTFKSDGYVIRTFLEGNDDPQTSTAMTYNIYDFNKTLVTYFVPTSYQSIFYFISPDMLCLELPVYNGTPLKVIFVKI